MLTAVRLFSLKDSSFDISSKITWIKAVANWLGGVYGRLDKPGRSVVARAVDGCYHDNLGCRIFGAANCWWENGEARCGAVANGRFRAAFRCR